MTNFGANPGDFHDRGLALREDDAVGRGLSPIIHSLRKGYESRFICYDLDCGVKSLAQTSDRHVEAFTMHLFASAKFDPLCFFASLGILKYAMETQIGLSYFDSLHPIAFKPRRYICIALTI